MQPASIAYPYLVTLKFECWGLVVRSQRTPTINAAIPWNKKLVSSIYEMDNVPAVYPCTSKEDAWKLAVSMWRQYAPAGCELQDEDGRIHAAVE